MGLIFLAGVSKIFKHLHTLAISHLSSSISYTSAVPDSWNDPNQECNQELHIFACAVSEPSFSAWQISPYSLKPSTNVPSSLKSSLILCLSPSAQTSLQLVPTCAYLPILEHPDYCFLIIDRKFAFPHPPCIPTGEHLLFFYYYIMIGGIGSLND